MNLTPHLSVDRITNSLVIKAPSPLIDEIEQLATTLDEAAGEQRERGLRIIPLQKTNARHVHAALETIIKSGRTSSSRSR